MKVLVVGGTGLIGRAVTDALTDRHEVVVASRQSGDVNVDVNDLDSIKKMYDSVGKVDAVVSTLGQVEFLAFDDMQPENYALGLNSKVVGQVNLVLAGRDYVNDGGSFTLTSGILNERPIPMGTSAAMANGAVEGFVIACTIELPREMRINVVSPTVITEAMDKYADYFPGFEPVPVATAALEYCKSV